MIPTNNKQTLCVHAGTSAEGPGVVNSIEPSTAYRYIDEGPQPYPRYFNTPNQLQIVDQICRLEDANAGLVFSSGMSAITTTMRGLLSRGDHVVLQRALYGGTFSFVLKEFQTLGIEYTLADCDVASFAEAVQPNTRMVYAETPANPLLQVVDLEALSDVTSKQGAVLVVDNTFASPINQNPIQLGVDVVVHSGTKYLGGHSDLSFGAVVGDSSTIEQIHSKAILYGGNLNPFALYLIGRSIKTLAVRVEKQNQNAIEIAQFLDDQGNVEQVYYPGLPSHSGYAIANKQMSGFGGMLSFRLTGNVSTKQFLNALQLVAPAMSLGGVETTVTVPSWTSHKPVPREIREQEGITDQLVRMSIGIESASDIVSDLETALKLATAASVDSPTSKTA